MAATEEYGYQRAGCQHFIGMANQMGINIYVPPESDLLVPSPLYGLCESSHWHIKNLARQKELSIRLNNATNTMHSAIREEAFLRGALDDLKYQMDTWGETRQGMAPSFEIKTQEEQEQAEAMTAAKVHESVANMLAAAQAASTDRLVAEAIKPKRKAVRSR